MFDSEPEILFVADVARLLRVSPESVRDWLADGSLPSSRPGRRRVVLKRELIRFVETRGRREALAR